MSDPETPDVPEALTRGQIALILADHMRWVIDRTGGFRDEEVFNDLLDRFGIDGDLRGTVLDVADLTDEEHG